MFGIFWVNILDMSKLVLILTFTQEQWITTEVVVNLKSLRLVSCAYSRNISLRVSQDIASF